MLVFWESFRIDCAEADGRECLQRVGTAHSSAVPARQSSSEYRAMIRKALRISSIVLKPVTLVSWCSVRDNLLEAHFAKITSGMSPSRVVGIMGAPSWDDRCRAKMPTGLPKQCSREMGYRVTLAPLLPTYYLIWYGNDGLVTDSSPIHSP
jgi:hypothetical protein